MIIFCVASSSIFFLNLPGTPIHSENGSTTLFSGTTVPAAMIDPSPIFALFRITEPMPIRQRSPIEQPCRVTECPTVTQSPMITPYLWRMPWSTLQSWTFEFLPMRMANTSPRIHDSCYIDESAQIIGDVEIGENSSVWMNAVIRGDIP